MGRCLIFWLFVLLGRSVLQAQPPGYTGRLWPIHLDVYAFPGLADWVFQPEGKLELNWRLGLEAERVVSRRLSVGVNYSFFQTRQNYLYQNQLGFVQLSGQSVGFQAKTYRFLRQGNIAPLGPYQKWEVQYLRYRLRDPDGDFPDFVDREKAVQDLILSFTLGTQRMIGESFTWHIGLQTAFALNIQGESISREPDPAAYQNQIAIRRLRGILAFSLNAGIGVLLF